MPKENPNELSERLRASIATDAVSVIAEARTLLKATKDPGRRRALAGVLVDGVLPPVMWLHQNSV